MTVFNGEKTLFWVEKDFVVRRGSNNVLGVVRREGKVVLQCHQAFHAAARKHTGN